jgi:hypothetical protein
MFFRSLRLFAVIAALAATLPTPAVATELEGSSGMVMAESTVPAETEGAQVFTGPFTVECSGSTVSTTTTNTGGTSETVKGKVGSLTFTGCNATVSVKSGGTVDTHRKEARTATGSSHRAGPN